MPRGLARLSVADLQSELRRRQRAAGRLGRRRAALLARLTRLDRMIELVGGSPNGRVARPGHRGRPGRRRPRNKQTLSQALQRALKGKTLGVAEAMAAVRRAGYRTTSSSFRTQVNIALIKGPFRRVGRGKYRAK